jgi:hypothetical protein
VMSASANAACLPTFLLATDCLCHEYAPGSTD